MLIVSSRLTSIALCCLLGNSASEYTGGYPEYDTHTFSAPCGTKHTGSNTEDVTEFSRHKPYFLSSVSSHPKDYIWIERGESEKTAECPLGTCDCGDSGGGDGGGVGSGSEVCTAFGTAPCKDSCTFFPLSETTPTFPDEVKYDDPDSAPEKHPFNYFYGVVTHVAFLLFQAILVKIFFKLYLLLFCTIRGSC